MAHQARKRFGQNFLTDLAVIDEIIRAINPQPDDLMVEIGPGRGALTDPLLSRLNFLNVVELDRDLAGVLRHRWAEKSLNIVQADVLQVDFGQFMDMATRKLRVVGNLPYNISTPLLFHMVSWADAIQDQHFMLQKEIVERMAAAPGDSQYGKLSIVLQMRYRIRHLFDVSPDAFEPAPKVTSAIVRMLPLAKESLRQPQDQAVFDGLLSRVFTQRRKMLRGSLGDYARLVDWDVLGVKPTARPQELSIEQYITMADMISSAAA